MRSSNNMNKSVSLRSLAALLSGGLLIASVPSRADEGMWTFDNPPIKQLQEKYHFTPTQEWLDHVPLSCVRLNDRGSVVFAPEDQIAFFGGDPDNFTYPRYDVDFALFRIYENGKPIENKDYLKWNSKGASENELVFVTGHPGSTQRLATVAQLEFERDHFEPNFLKLLRHRLDATKAYAALGEEQARQASTRIFGLENSLKAFEGRHVGLLDKNVMAKKKSDEEEFKSKVISNPEWKQPYGRAWDAIAEAMKKASTRVKQSLFESTDSQLASIGARIVDYVAEIKKPDAERLEGYHEAQLDSLRFDLFSPAPIYPGFEIARMTASLEQALQELGPDDPFVKIVLHGRSPKEVATEIINGTKLADPEVRQNLVEGV